MEKKKVKIFSYTKVWRVEKKIYSISNKPLPRPINPYDLLAFAGVVLFMIILEHILPFMTAIPTVIRYVGIPYMIVVYLTKKKLDGKNPIMYFGGCIIYFFTTRGTYLQRFKKYPDKQEKINLNWNCSMGRQEERNVSMSNKLFCR